MGEWADEWASRGVKNLWDTVPDVIEMPYRPHITGSGKAGEKTWTCRIGRARSKAEYRAFMDQAKDLAVSVPPAALRR